jgi:hypothetical protein
LPLFEIGGHNDSPNSVYAADVMDWHGWNAEDEGARQTCIVATRYRCSFHPGFRIRSLVLLVGGKQYAILGRND